MKETCISILFVVYFLVGFRVSAQTSGEPSIRIENQQSGKAKYLVKDKSWIKYTLRGESQVRQGMVREVFSHDMVVGADTVAYDDVKVIYGTVGRGDVLDSRRSRKFYILFGITFGICLLVSIGVFALTSFLFEAIFVFLYLFTYICLPFALLAIPLFIKSLARLYFPQTWRFIQLKS